MKRLLKFLESRWSEYAVVLLGVAFFALGEIVWTPLILVGLVLVGFGGLLFWFN